MSDIVLEAQRCLKCKNAKCSKACPVHTDIPLIMNMFLDGAIDEAGKILFENNPLTAFCSHICPHEQYCMGHCVLNTLNSPIPFYEIEQYISNFYLEKSHLEAVEQNGHRIAIIGAGPAGITLAFLMARKGYKITVIDSKDKIGGVLRYGIPEFRLPKSLLDKMLERMNDLDIKFRPNTLIGPTLTIDDLFRDGYDAVFIGTGVWKPNSLKIPGETLGNVHYAIDYLKNPDSYTQLGDKIVIIGAGNVAMDVARTILRKEKARVDIIFNRGEKEVTALHEELKMAVVDGAKMHYYLNTSKIVDDGVIVEPVIVNKDEEGNETYTIDIDNQTKVDATSVIIAIGQGPLSNIVGSTKDIDTNKKGLIEASPNGATSRPGVFAAGDVVHGAKTVAEAVAATKLVAEEIDNYIKSLE